MKKYCLFIMGCMFTLLGITYSYAKNTSQSFFSVQFLSLQWQSRLITNGVWQQGCSVPLKDLRIISVSYYDLAGVSHRDGKIILHKTIASSALHLFKELYRDQFPFSSISTLVEYKGDWRLAEENNATYGYSCKHDKNNGLLPLPIGKVITINPTLNPEIIMMNDKDAASITVVPNAAMFAINRKLKIKGMTEAIEKQLASHGFTRLNLPAEQLGWKRFIFSHAIPEQHKNNKFLSLSKFPSLPGTFTDEPLPPAVKHQLIKMAYWHADCPVPLERLSWLTFSYHDFFGQTQLGHLIIFDGLASELATAFEKLYRRGFPLEKTGDLNFSVTNEDTSAFNCRKIVGEDLPSLHAYGLAVDINVSRNPYLGAYTKNEEGNVIGTLIPSGSTSLSYIDRQQRRLGMNEAIRNTMAQHGLIEWGGDWQDRVDYMHFQVPRNIAQNLVYLDKDSAARFIKLIIKYPDAAKHMLADTRWKYLYSLYPQQFIDALSHHFAKLTTLKETQVINLVYMTLISQKNKEIKTNNVYRS